MSKCYLALLSVAPDGTYTEAVGCGRVELNSPSEAVAALAGSRVCFGDSVTKPIHATHYALFAKQTGGVPFGVYQLENPREIPTGGVPILDRGRLLIGVDMVGEELAQSIGNLSM